MLGAAVCTRWGALRAALQSAENVTLPLGPAWL